VQIEHVARIRLATRRAAQQERNLAVGLGLLGEVVVHDERVLALFHPVLAHRATGVRRQVLERRRVARGCGDDDGVFHRAVLAQHLDGLRNSRTLLADGDVDAFHAETFLVEDRVDRHRGFAGLAVADDEFALTATDRGHRVDGLDAGLQRLVHGLATHDARRLHFHSAQLSADDFALAVDRHAECIDHAAEHRVADGHRQDAAGRLHGLLFFDAVGITEHDDADRIFVEVEREADAAVFEFEQFVHGTVGQAAHARDAVADLRDATDGAGFDRRRVALETLGDRRRNFGGGECELGHVDFLSNDA